MFFSGFSQRFWRKLLSFVSSPFFFFKLAFELKNKTCNRSRQGEFFPATAHLEVIREPARPVRQAQALLVGQDELGKRGS